MSAKTWMKWLSVIALIFASLDLANGFYDLFTGGTLLLTSITVFILALIVVIISFGKDKKK